MKSSDNTLHLNRNKAMIGGVCAGLGDYFGIGTFFIRIAFVIAAFTWPPIIAVYVLLYLCLNDKPASEIASSVANNRVCRHLKNVNYRKRLYKSQRNKKVAGVCAGLADYFETSPFFIRLAFVLSLFFGPLAIAVYIIAAIIMDKEPVSSGDHSFQPGGGAPPRPVGKRDIHACSDKFANLEAKLRRLEATITSKKFKLHNELKRM